jgi:hypothetical protein
VAAALSAALLVLASIGRSAAQQAPVAPNCMLRLRVHLTPDVPNPRAGGFVSSLLGDNTGYQLRLRHVIDDTHLDMLLIGPGPKRNCREVIASMRKDSRVLSIEAR